MTRSKHLPSAIIRLPWKSIYETTQDMSWDMAINGQSNFYERPIQISEIHSLCDIGFWTLSWMISCAKPWTFECHMAMKNVFKRKFGRKCILKLHLMRGWEQNNFELTVWWQINPFCQKRMPQRSKNYVSWLIINAMCYYLWLSCEFIRKYPRGWDPVNITVLALSRCWKFPAIYMI